MPATFLTAELLQVVAGPCFAPADPAVPAPIAVFGKLVRAPVPTRLPLQPGLATPALLAFCILGAVAEGPMSDKDDSAEDFVEGGSAVDLRVGERVVGDDVFCQVATELVGRGVASPILRGGASIKGNLERRMGFDFD